MLVTLLLHVGGYYLVPTELLLRLELSDSADAQEVEVEFVEPAELPPELLRFVEANPEVPENEPDRKDQYSYRSTQAADERPSESELDAPNVDGETDSQKIIQGELQQAPVAPPAVVAPQVQPGEGPGTEGQSRGGGRAGAAVGAARTCPRLFEAGSSY